MKKVSLVASFTFLLFFLIFSYSFAQMEMGKGCQHEMKMIVQKEMSSGKCGMHQEGMMHQMGCCKMTPQMCMQMCGEEKMACCKKEFFLCCKEKLELTEKQVKALKSIKMDFMKNKIKMEAELKIAQLELKALMYEDEASLKEIERKMRSVEKLKTDMKISHLQDFREAKQVLTPEQKEGMMKHYQK